MSDSAASENDVDPHRSSRRDKPDGPSHELGRPSPDASSDPGWTRALWHAAATLIVALAPAQIYLRHPLWVGREDHRMNALGLAAAYALVAIGLGVWRSAPSSHWARAIESAVALMAAYGIVFFAFLGIPLDYSRGTIFLALLFALFFVSGSAFLQDGMKSRGASVGLALVAIALLAMGFATQDRYQPVSLADAFRAANATAQTETTEIQSHVYALEKRTYRHFFGVSEIAEDGSPAPVGGGIAPIGDGLVVATATGELFGLATLDPAAPLSPRSLGTSIPMDRAGYIDHFGDGSEPSYFRVTDLLIDSDGTSASGEAAVHLYAVHTEWIAADECLVMQVSKAAWASAESMLGGGKTNWQSFFRTSPCLPLQAENQGGRLVMTRDRKLVLSLGDFDRDGVKNPERFAQDPNVDYGKVIEIDPQSGAHRRISMGHRNPQGLFAAQDGSLWATEHGPRGGDELNRIVDGRNYGWPLATLGTAYYNTTWPLSERPGSHAGYEPPAFSWVPSVATTNLVRIEGDGFPHWRGDFVVGSLKERALWRVRMTQGKARYSERIDVGERVRDLVLDRKGRLLDWSDGGDLIVIEPSAATSAPGAAGAAAAEGPRLFAGCTDCHPAVRGESSPVAPNLAEVYGRPIASLTDYAYSSALTAKGGHWNEETLDAFLKAPSLFAPGAGRGMPGVSDPTARKHLIEYLKTLR